MSSIPWYSGMVRHYRRVCRFARRSHPLVIDHVRAECIRSLMQCVMPDRQRADMLVSNRVRSVQSSIHSKARAELAQLRTFTNTPRICPACDHLHTGLLRWQMDARQHEMNTVAGTVTGNKARFNGTVPPGQTSLALSAGWCCITSFQPFQAVRSLMFRHYVMHRVQARQVHKK
jgi:hypothetical protein